MTISYNWLCHYLPVAISPEDLSGILTSIGLEVESMETWEEIKGGLAGLVVGEVLSCEKHPDADKLKLTRVNVGGAEPLSIVCGASNVATGQKVIVATVGTTLYPAGSDPFTIKKAKIRGAESAGMICAEDEIGLGTDHSGIIVLPDTIVPGTPAAAIYNPSSDVIFEIGLTPNRMDAMSHLGVARDVCAYLSYHRQQSMEVRNPMPVSFESDKTDSSIQVTVVNPEACKRYCGIVIRDVVVKESPDWLKQRLKSIGLHPINNVVDITNFMLHETGQPLHAFDADRIKGSRVVVRTASDGETFVTLDNKERKMTPGDLLICDEESPMCIAGVYGGLDSGVSAKTKNIFLESACFDKGSVRKTSIRQDLKTDAANRFEKGVDISMTAEVLKRAASLIAKTAGGTITGALIDIFPNPPQPVTVSFSFGYLNRLSGKKYEPSQVRAILHALGFRISDDKGDELVLTVPFHKSDISIQADVVEEIMRIDGLDNIEIPAGMTIYPSPDPSAGHFAWKEKLSNYLTGCGFSEIFTNSITNSAYYDEATLSATVKMLNSLSSELDVMRPEMLQSGLEVLAHNLNRKNNHLCLYEFGKTYATSGTGSHSEKRHLVIYVTGNLQEKSWNLQERKADFFYLKGIVQNILLQSGFRGLNIESMQHPSFSSGAVMRRGKADIAVLGEVSATLLRRFDIKQPVYYADIDLEPVYAGTFQPVRFRELPKFPFVNRDLAILVDKNVSYSQIERIALSHQIGQLTSVRLFDIFESDKLGAGKKSMALSFTFLDENKTMTDKEIDGFMKTIITGFEQSLKAEIRK